MQKLWSKIQDWCVKAAKDWEEDKFDFIFKVIFFTLITGLYGMVLGMAGWGLWTLWQTKKLILSLVLIGILLVFGVPIVIVRYGKKIK